ncbi:MAG: hypothetical protein AB7O26_19665 [Planctomycetaceae bacterium]
MATTQKPSQPVDKKGTYAVTEKSTAPVTPALAQRIVSLDQFRGYTMAGMFLVNYLGGYKSWVAPVLLHHHNYLSYADTIMPHFLFAVGFSFRLTFGRRVTSQGASSAYFYAVRRILGLFLVAFVIYTFGRVAGSWDELTELGFWAVVKGPMKRDWMQTIGHIALTSLWLLPVIRSGALVRILYMIISAGAHVGLSYWFNYHWANTAPNGVDGGPLGFLTWGVCAMCGTLVCDAIAGSSGRASGWTLTKLIFWGVLLTALGYAMSCGTRMYDLNTDELAALKAKRTEQGKEIKVLDNEIEARKKQIEEGSKKINAAQEKYDAQRRTELRAKVEQMEKENPTNPLFKHFLVDKAERAYVAEEPTAEMKQLADQLAAVKAEVDLPRLRQEIREREEKKRTYRDVKLADDPVIPSPERWNAFTARVKEDWTQALTAPPFVMPPQDDPRIDAEPLDDHFLWNYWMVTQRGGSLSYTTMAAGISILVYVFFYIVCDIGGFQLGLFRTFGTNALAGYILHSMIGEAVKQFVPNGAPWWYGLTSFLITFGLIYLFLRTLEKNRIFLKL